MGEGCGLSSGVRVRFEVEKSAMDGNLSEMEEGEACYKEDDDDVVNPDIALSHIDQRIKQVLGHFQKDFEGGVTSESLGAKFGAYGSFLPTYKHSPSIWHLERTQRKNCNTPSSAGSLSLEGALQNLKASSNLPQSVRPQSNSCSSDVHNIREPLMAISEKHEACFPLTQASDRCPLKNGASIGSGSLTDLRSLKVRIKVRTDDITQRSAAIYNGLGLDDSPYTSSGDSLDGCDRKSHVEDSPDNIIQVMTSFSVPGGLLISPLPDSLLLLSKKENFCKESESMASFNSHQGHSSLLVDKTASLQVDTYLLKDKKKKSVGVNETHKEMKHGNKRRFDGDRKDFSKKKSEVVSRTQKFLANGLKSISLSNSEDNKSSKAVGRVHEISCEVNGFGMKEKSLTSTSGKEEMLELVYEQDSRKNDKQSSSSSLLDKASGNKAVSSYNSGLVGCDDSSKDNVTASLKDYSNASKCEEDVDLRRRVLQNATFHSENGSSLPSDRGKQTGQNKLKQMLSNGETLVVSKKDNSRAENGIAQKDEKYVLGGVYCGKSKTDKLESRIDNKVRDGQSDFLGDQSVEGIGYCQVSMAKASGDLQNENNPSFGKRPNKQFSTTKVDTHSISGASAKDIPSLCPPISENVQSFDIVPEAADPLLIEEDWVCCDTCQKWRLLPFGLKPEQLPEKWLCSMLNWLPGMNRCDISEDETTAALNALYQFPVSQNHNVVTASGVSTSDGYHLDRNYRNTSEVMLDQGKKKQNLKGMKHAGGGNGPFHISNSLGNRVPELGKGRNLNNKRYLPKPSLIKKSKVQHRKNEHSLNEKPMNGVDAKQLKMKRKQKDDDAHRPSERSKTEDTDMGKAVLNSNFDFHTVQRADIKNSETSFYEDSKCGRKDGILSMKKLGEQTQTSLDGGSVDVHRTKCDSFPKKRKLKEDYPHHQESALVDRVYVKEETSESGLRKEGKVQLVKTERKIYISSDGDGNSRKRVRMTPIYSSGSRDSHVDVTIVGDFGKDRNLKELNKDGFSEQAEAVELQQKDRGSKQESIVAAISNSNVSGNPKTKINYKEVNGSIVQSVSSPLRRSKNRTMNVCDVDKKDNFSSDFYLKSLKISTQDEGSDAMQKFSTEVLDSQLYDGDSNIKNQIRCSKDDSIYGSEQSNENRVKKTCDENALLSSRENMAYTSENKMKGTHPFNNCPKKIPKIELDVKPGSGKTSRNEKNHHDTNNSAKKRSTDNGMEAQIKDHDHCDLKKGPLSNSNGKYGLQQNPSLKLECGNKEDNVENDSKSGKSKCLMNSGGKSKQAHERAQDAHAQLLYSPDGEGMLKAIKTSVDYGMENGVNHNSGHLIPKRHELRNFSASSHDGMESLRKAANDSLKEAKDLRKYADRLKSSGFHFESNEAYFQAALKFLHGASLLETCNVQNGKHGEASQMQFYHCTVELFRVCAGEHEKRREMAAAALAYKCMEVAYMRIVYCKQYCLNRDRQDLLATLHASVQEPQGAGQTSASDNVNLNNHPTANKTIISMRTSCHADGDQVIVARDQPYTVWLLDFTEIVNLAMEASRKSRDAFSAASVTVEETQNRDFIASVKRVIDFSFQDVEELIRLVHLALKVSSYSGFGGTGELS